MPGRKQEQDEAAGAAPDRIGERGKHTLRSRILIGLVLLAIMVLLARNMTDLTALAATLQRAQTLWLLAALAIQVLTYVCVACGWRAVLEEAGCARPLGRLIPIAVGKLFADQAVPGAGLGGDILLVYRLVALGTPRGAAVAALLLSMLGYYIAFGLLAVLTLGLLWMHHHATPLLTGIMTIFLLVALVIPSLALWLRARDSEPLPYGIEQVQPIARLVHILSEAPGSLIGNRRLIFRVALLNGLVFLLDVVTLLVCLRALGYEAPASTGFIAIMIASVVATIGPIPLGLGSFEASCTAMLSLLGVPLAVALAGTLLLRGFTLWLPLVPGFILARKALRSADRPTRGSSEGGPE